MIRLVVVIDNAIPMSMSPGDVIEKYILSPQLQRVHQEEKPTYIHEKETPVGKKPLFTVCITEIRQIEHL